MRRWRRVFWRIPPGKYGIFFGSVNFAALVKSLLTFWRRKSGAECERSFVIAMCVFLRLLLSADGNRAVSGARRANFLSTSRTSISILFSALVRIHIYKTYTPKNVCLSVAAMRAESHTLSQSPSETRPYGDTDRKNDTHATF